MRKVRPREFVLGDELEHARVDARAERFDCVPDERVATALWFVEEAERQNEPAGGENPYRRKFYLRKRIPANASLKNYTPENIT